MWLLRSVICVLNVVVSSNIGSHSHALPLKLGSLSAELAALDVFKRLLSWSAVRFNAAMASLSDELLLSKLFESELVCENSLRYLVRLVLHIF